MTCLKLTGNQNNSDNYNRNNNSKDNEYNDNDNNNSNEDNNNTDDRKPLTPSHESSGGMQNRNRLRIDCQSFENRLRKPEFEIIGWNAKL